MRVIKLFLAVVVLSVLIVRCTPNDNNPDIAPDVSDFNISNVTAIVPGIASIVTIKSKTLADGTYTVNYDLSGANSFSNQSAVLTMANKSGNFSTPVLNNTGSTTIVINSLTNSGNKTSVVLMNNTFSFNSTTTDSTGLMTATVNGSSTFRATDVKASISGGQLSVSGTVWTPGVSNIVLYVDNYTHTAGTTNFSGTANGSAHYSAPGVVQVASYGYIRLSTVSPLMTGTFSFTNPDSSKVSGSFTVAAP